MNGKTRRLRTFARIFKDKIEIRRTRARCNERRDERMRQLIHDCNLPQSLSPASARGTDLALNEVTVLGLCQQLLVDCLRDNSNNAECDVQELLAYFDGIFLPL